MNVIYQSRFNNLDERGESIIVYELEEGEYDKLFEEYEDNDYFFDGNALLENLGYVSDWGYVTPGSVFTRYELVGITAQHLVIAEIVSRDI